MHPRITGPYQPAEFVGSSHGAAGKVNDLIPEDPLHRYTRMYPKALAASQHEGVWAMRKIHDHYLPKPL